MKNNVKAVLTRASVAIDNGELMYGIALCKSVIAFTPKNNKARNLLSIAKQIMGSKSQSSKPFEIPQTEALEAKSLFEEKRYLVVKKRLSDLLEIFPKSVFAFHMLGTIHSMEKEYRQAQHYFSRALDIMPLSADILANFGSNELALAKPGSAIPYLENSLEIFPESLSRLFTLGQAYTDANDSLSAKNILRKAVKVELITCPGGAQALKKLVSLHSQNQEYVAIKRACYDVLASHPNHLDAKILLAYAYRQTSNFSESEKILITVLQAEKQNAVANHELGQLLMDMGQPARAIVALEDSLLEKAKNALAKTQLAQCYLMLGNFEKGWKGYESRFDVPRPYWTSPRLITEKPQWTGKCCDRLLVWTEQGLGDEIMYASMIPDLASYCKKLVVICDQRLHSILERSFDGNIQYLPKSAKPDDSTFDFHIPMGSLGSILRPSIESFAKRQSGFLIACREQTEKWASKLVNNKQKVVGLSWKSANPQIGEDKSVQLSSLLSNINHNGTKFISLQYGNVEAETKELAGSTYDFDFLYDLDKTNDLEGLMAALNLCDEVITVSNATAHLAGAMGKKTKIMLSCKTDWRWHHSLSVSYWYKNCLLYRQRDFSNWENLFKTVSR